MGKPAPKKISKYTQLLEDANKELFLQVFDRDSFGNFMEVNSNTYTVKLVNLGEIPVTPPATPVELKEGETPEEIKPTYKLSYFLVQRLDKSKSVNVSLDANLDSLLLDVLTPNEILEGNYEIQIHEKKAVDRMIFEANKYNPQHHHQELQVAATEDIQEEIL